MTAAAMLGVLEKIDQQWGGAKQYALAAGVSAKDLDRLQARLIG
ncbi:MAG: tyrosine-protein phosphatase [Gaiellaceae bacterium]